MPLPVKAFSDAFWEAVVTDAHRGTKIDWAAIDAFWEAVQSGNGATLESERRKIISLIEDRAIALCLAQIERERGRTR